ncbi:MAG: adenosylcobalamin-dependent ribonucleoside-diphosphate reductase [Gammaproteobacteria bacterium]
MPGAQALPPQAVSVDVLREKYTRGAERSVDEVRARVARAAASVETDPGRWESVFLEAQRAGFIPAGRIASAAGTDLAATLINCFVQPIGDSIAEPAEGRPGIYTALAQAAETMRRGGGVGYDFSAIRPAGALVHGTGSRASGPVSYMRVFDRSCETVESAGARRGAQMGVLRCDHPDILAFVHAKDHPGELTNFNISVAITEEFMRAVGDDADFDLVHRAEPARPGDARRRADGAFVYRTVRARALWDEIMRSTYDHAEPGVIFIDRVNAQNNLWYAERIEACNPCGEQPLPAWGCCCLGSIDLTRFVLDPFAAGARFDEQAFARLVPVAVRMLDDVLDLSVWPLPEQRAEARAKRRIGLGFTGLGDTLVMLGLRYDAPAACAAAAGIARLLRDCAYRASIELARERGAFARFAPEYLDGAFVRRLPDDIRAGIRAHGIRNSHLLSIAPTGTISLAFADNASNGIEPPYAWSYWRVKRGEQGQVRYQVEDHAFRRWKAQGGDPQHLPAAFVTALELPAAAHVAMLEAVQPYVDSAISKTVNIPADYPFEDFAGLYLQAWRAGLKGLSTFRPNAITGAVLSTQAPQAQVQPRDFDETDPDRRLRLERVPRPALASLRWPGRPLLPNGNPGWTYMVEPPGGGQFALFVGHVGESEPYPFEIWVNGAEQPRGLGAIAKTLSMDMRADDRGWLRAKLEVMTSIGGDPFELPMPPRGDPVPVPGAVAALALLVRHRLTELGAFAHAGPSPMLDALLTVKEPKTGTDGTMSWTVDVANPATGDEFSLGLKELVMPSGERRPYALWVSGTYPRALDGLCAILSMDMRVIDPAWIGTKLRKLLNYPEPMGDFIAWIPGARRQRLWPSTVAYLARLVIHRYAMLGILDEGGLPCAPMGVLDLPRQADTPGLMPGRPCRSCGASALIRKDGCDFCTACGELGACG